MSNDSLFRAAILTMLGHHDGPMLASEITLHLQAEFFGAMGDLQREGAIAAVYPDAREGDSGAQHWELSLYRKPAGD